MVLYTVVVLGVWALPFTCVAFVSSLGANLLVLVSAAGFVVYICLGRVCVHK